MKKLLISTVLALALVAVMAAPVMAATEDETSIGASVSVNEFVSISLTDAGAAGIDFGSVDPSDTVHYGDVAQSDGTPAIKVNVEAETNVDVDIDIKGETAGALTIGNWKYSETFAGAKVSLTGTYDGPVYEDVTAGTAKDFYQWISVPSGTDAGAYSATVYYKAVKAS